MRSEGTCLSSPAAGGLAAGTQSGSLHCGNFDWSTETVCESSIGLTAIPFGNAKPRRAGRSSRSPPSTVGSMYNSTP